MCKLGRVIVLLMGLLVGTTINLLIRESSLLSKAASYYLLTYSSPMGLSLQSENGNETSTQQQQQPSPNQRSKIVMLVQGQAKNFDSHHERIMMNPHATAADIVLVYATYDVPLEKDNCRGQEVVMTLSSSSSSSVNQKQKNTTATRMLPPNRNSCHSLFIPNTTWTEGRNLLGQFASCLEKQYGQEFLYWIFSDDDAKLQCPRHVPTPTLSNKERNYLCWKRYIHYLTVDVPNQVPSVTVVPMILAGIQNRKHFGKRLYAKNQYISTMDNSTTASPQEILVTPPTPFAGALLDSYDAIWNAFGRQTGVPYLLPYLQNMYPNASQWQSAFAQYYVNRHCLPYSALINSEFIVKNDAHRAYTRGKDPTALAAMIRDNYQSYYNLTAGQAHPETPFFRPSNHHPDLNMLYRLDRVQSLAAAQERLVQSHQAGLLPHTACREFTRRFDDWINDSPFVVGTLLLDSTRIKTCVFRNQT